MIMKAVVPITYHISASGDFSCCCDRTSGRSNTPWQTYLVQYVVRAEKVWWSHRSRGENLRLSVELGTTLRLAPEPVSSSRPCLPQAPQPPRMLLPAGATFKDMGLRDISYSYHRSGWYSLHGRPLLIMLSTPGGTKVNQR